MWGDIPNRWGILSSGVLWEYLKLGGDVDEAFFFSPKKYQSARNFLSIELMSSYLLNEL